MILEIKFAVFTFLCLLVNSISYSASGLISGNGPRISVATSFTRADGGNIHSWLPRDKILPSAVHDCRSKILMYICSHIHYKEYQIVMCHISLVFRLPFYAG